MVLEKSDRLDDPYVTAGDRVYAIGAQNGLFPDLGSHLPGEMGGVWDHPIKLLDGYWLAVDGEWLVQPLAFEAHAGWNAFRYRCGERWAVRREFAPDGHEGLIVSLTVGGAPGRVLVTLLARSDLRPAWLGERVGMVDSPDQGDFHPDLGAFVIQDQQNPWFVVVGATNAPQSWDMDRDLWGPQRTAGQGVTVSLTHELTIPSGGRAELVLVIAGSAVSETEAVSTFNLLCQEHQTLFAHKRQRYGRVLRRATKWAANMVRSEPRRDNEVASNGTLLRSVPDYEQLVTACGWAAVNLLMLDRRVPGVGSGLGAGLPEYPWWFGCDMAYSVPPMVQVGLYDLARRTLLTLADWSRRTNGPWPGGPTAPVVPPPEPSGHRARVPGRIVHEISSVGAVYNPGNLVETPLFVRALYAYFQATGDHRLLRDLYPLCKEGILGYVLAECDPDGDLCASGRSIVETADMHSGLETLDTACYTWEALNFLAQLAPHANDVPAVSDYLDRARRLANLINQEWWMEEEGLFADLRGATAEMAVVIEGLRNRQGDPAAIADLDRQLARYQRQEADDPSLAGRDWPWLRRHWIGVVPMEVGVAAPEKAVRALERLESAEFSGPWGLYLRADLPITMSLTAGVMAVAEARYGRWERALAYATKIAETLTCRTPGCISEASPDQWCFLQAWSAYGLIMPLANGIPRT